MNDNSYIGRPRLLESLRHASVVLLEAGGGYGKSVLALELADALPHVRVDVTLDQVLDDPVSIAAACVRALDRAGLYDAARSLRARLAEPADCLAALVDVLERQPDPLLLLVDEAGRAEGAAGALLTELGARLPADHRLLLAARRLPDTRPAGQGVVHLGAAELAFDDDEVAQVVAAITGRARLPHEVAVIARGTGGWPAAVVLAAAEFARSGAAPQLDPEQSGDLLDHLVNRLLAPLRPEQCEQLRSLAQLPLIDTDLARAAVGDDILALAQDVGLPLVSPRRGWLQIPDAVREALARGGRLDHGAVRLAATAYADRDELPLALAFLVERRDFAGITELLATRRWQELRAFDISELRAYLSLAAGDESPSVAAALLRVARVAESAHAHSYRALLIEEALAAQMPDRVRRELQAERAVDLARAGEDDAAMATATAVLDAADSREIVARARALYAFGRAAAFRRDSASRFDAERTLVEAATLFEAVHEPEWQAETLVRLGYGVHYAWGDLDQATRRLDEALTVLEPRTANWATIATFAAQVFTYAGATADAASVLTEAAKIGRVLADDLVRAYVGWEQARLAAFGGDLAATVERLREVQRYPGDWFEHPTGVEFLADATDMLARLGAETEARDYLEHAVAGADAVGHPEIAWGALGSVEARFGDPVAAEQALLDFDASPQQPPREVWRMLFLRALAADRAGRGDAAALAARAFAAAAGLGDPELPARHEPLLVRRLSALAATATSPGPRPAGERQPRLSITTLGSFSVAADGRPMPVPPGKPATLVKRLALERRLTVDEAIDMLWPDASPEVARGRLRNLVSRLRTATGDLVRREDEALVLSDAALVDAVLFESAATAALESADDQARLARIALARYAGELLPDDVYEEWAALPRERLRRRYLELLDVLVDDAIERESVDEAIRLLDHAIEAEPFDEDRYLRAAELLLFQGRRGGAQAMVRRATAVRAELSLPVSPRLARLQIASGALDG